MCMATEDVPHPYGQGNCTLEQSRKMGNDNGNLKKKNIKQALTRVWSTGHSRYGSRRANWAVDWLGKSVAMRSKWSAITSDSAVPILRSLLSHLTCLYSMFFTFQNGRDCRAHFGVTILDETIKQKLKEALWLYVVMRCSRVSVTMEARLGL